jgi:hypothetical protein
VYDYAESGSTGASLEKFNVTAWISRHLPLPLGQALIAQQVAEVIAR